MEFLLYYWNKITCYMEINIWSHTGLLCHIVFFTSRTSVIKNKLKCIRVQTTSSFMVGDVFLDHTSIKMWVLHIHI